MGLFLNSAVYRMPQPEVDRTIAAAMAVVRVHLLSLPALCKHLCMAPEALLVPPG